ncbi:hypothetical protein MICCA_80031 [Microcystis aeruginosa PCC 9432]|uniref:Uncharacterized protein n=3 Tax=Microcystis aeruginosa TaxID=1126 RepID=A0A830ZWQ1_MICAE|nr:hypothetical protein BH695_2132 [Microcystis aeruginosa PCC 7806SL]ELP52393.1 putative membrane protein [Microcystis aeruginosa TAIHU98]ELS48086.1 hypothetical protein C789_2106 [Microcystis aeruginosa FACHB-905 = DIANCHI905]GBE97118.1 hypothetical protein NIES298_13670 [Microcystis aeruginosa NIES-298]CCH95363.1 hypothetical protein MICCA_80031 [Microcystis aeruginosa PCC 9432]
MSRGSEGGFLTSLGLIVIGLKVHLIFSQFIPYFQTISQ